MKLWILEAREGFADGWDQYDGFVIEAETARAARALAAKNGADEQPFSSRWPAQGRKPIGGWLDSKKATCRELKPHRFERNAKIILSSFNAG